MATVIGRAQLRVRPTGDLILLDNRCVMHRRVMHRNQTQGDHPV